MYQTGTYQNGFAPRDYEPLYPELWDGCVGAWNPGLGPSGLTLRDSSPYRNHGTLTGMDPGSDWVKNQGRYALDFDGTNDSVVIGNIPRLAFERTQPFSVCVWVNPSTVAGVAYGVVGNSTANTPNTGWGILLFRRSSLTATALSFFLVHSASPGFNLIELSSPENSVVANKWQHLAITYNGSSDESGVVLYINGILQAKTVISNALSGSTVTTQNTVIGARPDNGQLFPGQIGDCGIYNRTLSPIEIRLLASHPGIAYELAPRRRKIQSESAFNAYWAAKRSQFIGLGA